MNKEEMATLKKSNRVAIVIMMVLVVVGLVSSIILIFTDFSLSMFPVRVANSVMYILVAYYSLWGHKKPHGDLMKYMILTFGVVLIPPILTLHYGQMVQIVYPIIILLIGYMAGRLNRFRENRIIAVIVTTLFIVVLIAKIFIIGLSALPNENSLINSLGPLNKVVLWLTIWVAYSTRYALHKEAGLQDKPASSR